MITHILLRECPKCHQEIGWLVEAKNPVIPDANFDELADREEIWCDYPGCGWHGKVALTKSLGRALGRWLD